jgi:hypothetical protein
LEAVGSFVKEFWWLFALIAIVAVPLILRYVLGVRFSVAAFFLILFIVAVFASMTMPALSRSTEQARLAVSRSNLKQIGLALAIYANDNDGWFPPSLDALYKRPEFVRQSRHAR